LYDLDMDLYGAKVESDALDQDVEVYMVLGEDNYVYILHDAPFAKTISWIEYDEMIQKIDFIMEDGDLRNFKVSVDPRFSPYLKTMDSIAVAEVSNGEFRDGNEVPLVRH